MATVDRFCHSYNICFKIQAHIVENDLRDQLILHIQKLRLGEAQFLGGAVTDSR